MTKPTKDEVDGPTKLDQARKILGSRLTVRGSLGYFLDGHPANVLAVLRAAGL